MRDALQPGRRQHRHLVALLAGGANRIVAMGRNMGRDQCQGIELQRLLCSIGRGQVPVVNRIERAAEEPQGHRRRRGTWDFSGS